MLKYITLILVVSMAAALAKPLTELKLSGNTRIDTDHVDCKMSDEIIDECSLQQGFSYRYADFAYPTNHTFLMSSCKRQTDALKCLKAYAKCLPPLSKQVLITLVNSRQKYNKRICTEKPSEAANKVIEMSRCMLGNKGLHEKGMQAEVNAIVAPEAIIKSNIESIQERLRHSCCSVAKARREFIDTTNPHCKQHAQTAVEMIDSYLAETTGIICPDPDGKRYECDKLSKLPTAKSSHQRHFMRPILGVVQTLA